MKRHPLPHGEIIRARVESVYPTIADGSVTLLHSDGPYGMGKAAWDKVRDLAAWYRPHIAEWGRICAPSASVYLWNTAEGWAAIHPEMCAAGWTFRTLVTWDKVTLPALIGWRGVTSWIDQTEVCGFYTRGRPPFSVDAPPLSIWRFDASNDLRHEKIRATDGVKSKDGLYTCKQALHPCQKPLTFAERIIEASSRPGDLVFEPFGGTCRIAVANEQIARYRPEAARRTLTVEMDEDGCDYIGAVLRSIGRAEPLSNGGQLAMFGTA